MGLFSKKAAPPSATVGRMGSGRKLRSSAGADQCRRTLEDVVDSYRKRKYAQLPLVVNAGYVWQGDGQPSHVVSFEDDGGDFVLATFVAGGTGTEIGLFPLGSGDQRLQLSLPGHWKMRDGSLGSIGTYPAGTVALREPTVGTHYVQEMLTFAGRPQTARNVTALRDKVTQLFLIKCHEYIGSQDRSGADRFVAQHRDSMDLQGILRDLARWNAGVLPYIQDLPVRIRALLLDASDSGESDLWLEMDR